MEPSKKHPELESLLNVMTGRGSAIRNNLCIKVPLGCGKPVTIESFRDAKSLEEYKISGLCQECQDSIFGVSDDY